MEKVKILVVGKPELSEYLGDLPPNAVVLDIGVEFTAFTPMPRRTWPPPMPRLPDCAQSSFGMHPGRTVGTRC